MKFRYFKLPDAVRAAVDSRIQPWHRYHGFLTIILLRYKANAAKYNPNPAPGTRIYRVEEDLRQILQLDVETFYQYSNMMLDQIAENRFRVHVDEQRYASTENMIVMRTGAESEMLAALDSDLQAALKEGWQLERHG